MSDKRTITFRDIQADHRRERQRDAQRIRTGSATARQVQEENSIFPWETEIRIVNLAASIRRSYRR